MSCCLPTLLPGARGLEAGRVRLGKASAEVAVSVIRFSARSSPPRGHPAPRRHGLSPISPPIPNGPRSVGGPPASNSLPNSTLTTDSVLISGDPHAPCPPPLRASLSVKPGGRGRRLGGRGADLGSQTPSDVSLLDHRGPSLGRTREARHALPFGLPGDRIRALRVGAHDSPSRPRPRPGRRLHRLGLEARGLEHFRRVFRPVLSGASLVGGGGGSASPCRPGASRRERCSWGM